MLKKEKFQLFIHDQPMEQPTVHSEIEIIYVLEGSVNAKVDQKEVLLSAVERLEKRNIEQIKNFKNKKRISKTRKNFK